MPRGRKRKVVLETSGDEEAMDDAVEAALASATSGNDDVKAELPKIDEAGEATDDGNDEAGEAAPPVSKLDLTKAQDELTNLDLLVCGKCHFVFHFTEELLTHKKSECQGVSDVFSHNTKSDSKAQVWAFVLYKSHKLREKGSSGDWNTSSWQLYQKWSKLNENVKQTWVEAGKALQQIAVYLPQNTLKASIKPKPRAILTPSEREQQQQTLLELQKELEDDSETQMMSTLGLVRGKGKDEKDQRAGLNQIWRKSLTKKDGDEEEEELYTVEKIVAKRVNPKTRQPEYLVKWVGFQSDQNTWEHIQNMASCMKLVQEFEKNLARQKARKALEASKLGKNVLRLEDIVQTTPGGRPVRSSALKAMDQVKEWVGGKRALDSDDESGEEEEHPAKRGDLDMLKKKLTLGGKSPVIVANSRGVVRVDPKQVPNLSSGVYILSTQSGLIKVDDSTATKLTSCLSNDAKKIANERTLMINETEVRKIPASQATPKIGILRKDLTSGIMKKENSLSPNVNILQKIRTVGTTGRAILGRSPLQRQIVLGSPKTRPLPGPVPSPLRPPGVRPKISIKPPIGRPKQGILGGLVRKQQRVKIEDDFEGGLTDEFPKDDDPIAPASPNRPLTLCPLTGEVLGRAEGEKSPSQDEDGNMPDVDDDGMMRVAVSPGGSIHQVVQQRVAPRNKQTRSLLTQRRAAEQQQQAEEIPQEQELISIESEDGIIYQITPEQQQLLMQNGTLTMDNKQEENFAEHTEIMIENGQMMGNLDEAEPGQDEQGMVLGEGEDGSKEQNEEYDQEGVLTLDSAVQEAVSQAAEQNEAKTDDGQQMVAQIVQAEPPTPGGGPRKVVLLLPDGSLLETEMEEEQYQALDFEK